MIVEVRGFTKTYGEIKAVELNLKKEIEQVRGEIRAVELKIELVRAELKTDIERLKTALLKWLVPLMFAQVAAIAALVKLL